MGGVGGAGVEGGEAASFVLDGGDVDFDADGVVGDGAASGDLDSGEGVGWDFAVAHVAVVDGVAVGRVSRNRPGSTVTTSAVGGAIGPTGVTEPDGVDAGLVPATLVAVTVNV